MMRWDQRSNLKEIIMLSAIIIRYLDTTPAELIELVAQHASSDTAAYAAIMWLSGELKRQKQNPGADA